MRVFPCTGVRCLNFFFHTFNNLEDPSFDELTVAADPLVYSLDFLANRFGRATEPEVRGSYEELKKLLVDSTKNLENQVPRRFYEELF